MSFPQILSTCDSLCLYYYMLKALKSKWLVNNRQIGATQNSASFYSAELRVNAPTAAINFNGIIIAAA
jgi:hypothetical protein